MRRTSIAAAAMAALALPAPAPASSAADACTDTPEAAWQCAASYRDWAVGTALYWAQPGPQGGVHQTLVAICRAIYADPCD